MQSRFNQIVDESSSTGKNLLAWYTKHGIAVKDEAGQLRSLYDVMSDLAPKWDSLSKNEQSYFLQQAAGARQSQNLAALLSNFSGVQKATELAYNSSGSAAAENAKVLDSLEAKTTALKATWEDFANKTIDSELVKSLLNLANGALKVLNTEAGRTLTQFVLLSGVFTGLGGIIAQVIPVAIKSIKAFTSVLAGATTGVKALQASVPVVGIAMAALTVMIGLVKDAYDAQYGTINKINKSIETINATYTDATNIAKANAEQAKYLVGVIEDLNKVENMSTSEAYKYKSAVDQLNKIYPDLNLSIGEHTGKIKEDTGAIYKRIEAMKQEALQAALQEKQTAYYGQIIESKASRESAGDKLRAEMQELQERLKRGFDITGLGENLDVDVSLMDTDDLIRFYENVLRYGIFPSFMSKEVSATIEEIRQYDEAIENAEGKLERANVAAQSLGETVANLNTQAGKNAGITKAQRDNVDNLAKAQNALNKAVQDYNTYGGLQSETQEALDEALPGLNDLLYDEAGALTSAGKAALRGSKELTQFVLLQKQEELQAQKTALSHAEAAKAEALRFRTRQSLMGQTQLLSTAEEAEAEAARQDALVATAEQNIKNIEDEIAWLEQLLATYSSSSSAASSATDTYKKAFTDWLAYKDHQLAMDEITEEQYYAELTEMVDKFFKGKSKYQEEYWQYSEKIYAYEKKRMQELVEESTKSVEDAVDKINEKYDSELSRLEEVNDALSDQIEYEKLLDEMAKAREQKKLVYKDGRFQYVQDADAISAAQAKLDEYNRNKGLEASKADIEARRKAEVRQTILDKMQANSAAWATSTSSAEREALHNANVELAKLLEDNSTYDAATGKWSSYANGTLGATGGMSLVGENGPEMRILNRGDGILTSGVTKNLFAWGSTSPSDFVSALKGLMGFKFGNSSNTTVNVNNLELPNVTNAREFVTGLKNLALQYAYERG